MFLAMAYWQLGEKEMASHWRDQAERLVREKRILTRDFTPLDFQRIHRQMNDLLSRELKDQAPN
jgi:hypothetical protein